jgi:hypothetical protein
VNRTADFVDKRRREAWAFGRSVRDRLLSEYQLRYNIAVPPAPGQIIDELLTDFLGANLRFDPLPPAIFAQTEWMDGRPVVTVNALAGQIPGVKDREGVENVGKWHEAVHVVRDLDVIRASQEETLPGFGTAPRITCHRSGAVSPPPLVLAREFWAEEAGRAAAVSLPALDRSDAFRELCDLGRRSSGPVPQGFPLLYRAAKDIGVNVTALVKQLTLEGQIMVVKESGRRLVMVQPPLAPLAGITGVA